MDADWAAILESSPANVVEMRLEIEKRAAELCAPLLADAWPAHRPTDLDVVVNGCGFLSTYFLGAHTVLDVLEKAGRVQLHRYAGASSGAMTPMELLVLGQVSWAFEFDVLVPAGR